MTHALSATRIQTLILAGMLADAVGVPYEFKARHSFRATTMTGHGTYDMPIGTWSDDSSLTLALMVTLTEGGDQTDYMTRLVDYMDNGRYTPAGELFDIGHATSKAIIAFVTGTPAKKSGDRAENANGNGAIMRLAPLAITLQNVADPAARVAATIRWTQVTHAHPRALIGSVLYVETLRGLLADTPLPTALKQARAVVLNAPTLPNEELVPYAALFGEDFAQTPRDRIASTGYVVDSLLAATWVAANANDYEDTVLTAVNLGDDTDTIALLAATLFAAGRPTLELPSEWLTQLILPEEARSIIQAFAAQFAG